MTVIIVLYQRTTQQSAAYQSLLRWMETAARTDLHVLVYDNSPGAGEASSALPDGVQYYAAEENRGLAKAYNLALQLAAEREDEWLLLLDQDTSLTPEYGRELTAVLQAVSSDASIAAVVPRLAWNGVVYSPESSLFDQLRSQFPHRSHALPEAQAGVQLQRLAAYNSGALLRVAALQAIGGFPAEFWLDYLDHAVFHLLGQHNYCTYVMRSTLQHPLAHTDPNAVPLWRERNVLSAQTLLVKRFGNLIDRLLYRLYLLRMGWRSLRESRDHRVGLEKWLQALFLRVPALTWGAGHP